MWSTIDSIPSSLRRRFAGLGASVDLIDRIVGTGDPDLLLLFKAAKTGKQGRPRKGAEKIDDSSIFSQDHDADDPARLARDAPDQYEAIKRGKKSIPQPRSRQASGTDAFPSAWTAPSRPPKRCASTCLPEQLEQLRKLLPRHPVSLSPSHLSPPDTPFDRHIARAFAAD